MNEIKLNLENLSDAEREQLMALVEKANKPKSKAWKPKNGERYWTISAEGDVLSYAWSGDTFDNTHYDIGNVFCEEGEAHEEITCLKMLKRWKDLSIESGEEDNPWDANNEHWYAYYGSESNTIRIGNWTVRRDSNTFFASREICEAAIKELGEDNVKKYILGIKN